MQSRICGNEYRTTIVCVDSYERGIPVGRFYNPCLTHGDAFQSLMEFFRKMEEMLDAIQLPQSFTAPRSFAQAPPWQGEHPPEPEIREGRQATFAVRVIFRQNASWQGAVTWLEGNREESFRSALELAFLMDSALTGAAETPKAKRREAVSPSCGA